MQLQDRSGDDERQAVIAAVTSRGFLSRAVGRVGKEPFRSKWANLVWSWCEGHYLKYGKSPRHRVASLARDWLATRSDRETATLLERLLSSLSDQAERGEKLDLGFALDRAEKHFNEVLLERLQESLRTSLAKGGVDGGLESAEGFLRVKLSSPPRLDLLADREAHERALSSRSEPLIVYPGAAGLFFGKELARDAFVGVMAQSKGGKSYMLLDFAWRAMRQGRQVAYFQVGDLSQDQIVRRFQRRAARRPFEPRVVQWPVGISLPEGRGCAQVEHEARVFDTPLTLARAMRAMARAGRKGGKIMLSYHPLGTVGVPDVRSVLSRWDAEGWTADVVVIDYAGNLAPSDPKASPVDQVSRTWGLLRQLSEVRKCLVVTAQQSNKEGFRAWALTRNNFSDSKMILAHVTAFYGVNMTPEEKESGVMRLNCVVGREVEFSETKCLWMAACLALADPCVVSYFP